MCSLAVNLPFVPPPISTSIDSLCQNSLESRANWPHYWDCALLRTLPSACGNMNYSQPCTNNPVGIFLPAPFLWFFPQLHNFLTLSLKLKRTSLQISKSDDSRAALSPLMLFLRHGSCFGLLQLSALALQSSETIGLGFCFSSLHHGLWAGVLFGL